MLKAVIHGKKRGTGLEGKSFRLGEAAGAEDILTSTVFERLAYLPDRALQDVLRQLTITEFDALDEIQFWPRWAYAATTIEPDVVLNFPAHRVIVEAKRYDHSQQQYALQLSKELLAYWASAEMDERPITLLTVGGMEQYTFHEVGSFRQKIEAELKKLASHIPHKFHLACVSWQSIYRAIEQAMQAESNYGGCLRRLLDDIGEAFAWHGIRTHPQLWLSTLDACDISHASAQCIRNLKYESLTRRRITPLATLSAAAIETSSESIPFWKSSQ